MIFNNIDDQTSLNLMKALAKFQETEFRGVPLASPASLASTVQKSGPGLSRSTSSITGVKARRSAMMSNMDQNELAKELIL